MSGRERPHLDPGLAAIVDPPDPATALARSRDRLAAAVADGADLPARAADAAVLEVLRSADITALGRVTYSSNAVFVAELDAPDPFVEGERMRAVYKPMRGERPLWDFARGSLALRELAAYAVDAALGFNLLPPVTARHGPHGDGSMQLFIPAAGERPSDDAVEAALHRVATFDVITNNADRKSAHLLLGPERHIWAIDNALTFLPYPRQRTVLLDLGGTALPDDCATAVRALAENDALGDLTAALTGLLDTAEIEALRARLAELAGDPVYPVLDPWDGRPWGW